MICAAYSAMHFLIDFLCSWAMFSRFRLLDDVYFQILIYNFCAFAFQMPLGALLDLFIARTPGSEKRWISFFASTLGVLLTVVGASIAPWILGCGNALFHVGGGIDVIQEDFLKDKRGKYLGIFVSPGAIGLYLGSLIGQTYKTKWIMVSASALLVMISAVIVIWKRKMPVIQSYRTQPIRCNGFMRVLVCCFAVVILRSLTGFYVTFPWKNKSVLAFLWVIAVASGKLSGGMLSAKYGMTLTAILSLGLSGVFFLLGDIPVFGFAAIFLFNMTMPVTLYLLVCRMPILKGFSFGVLTFGLFLGYLPLYANLSIPIPASAIGMLGSILSLIILLLCGRMIRK